MFETNPYQSIELLKKHSRGSGSEALQIILNNKSRWLIQKHEMENHLHENELFVSKMIVSGLFVFCFVIIVYIMRTEMNGLDKRILTRLKR
jgi:hypothetical protein